jgi:hypothetical protein
VSRALNGGDENSPKDMGALVGNASLIQAGTRAAVLLLHHIPADGTQRLRGHGALLGAVDVSISVEKHAAGRTATLDKANDGEEGERVSFTLQSVQIADDGTTAPVVVPTEITESFANKGKRRLSDKQRLADAALDEALLARSLPAPGAYGLPNGISVVDVDAWRTEMFRRGVLSENDPNPRQEFRRLRDALAARAVIGQRDNFVWKAAG